MGLLAVQCGSSGAAAGAAGLLHHQRRSLWPQVSIPYQSRSSTPLVLLQSALGKRLVLARRKARGGGGGGHWAGVADTGLAFTLNMCIDTLNRGFR